VVSSSSASLCGERSLGSMRALVGWGERRVVVENGAWWKREGEAREEGKVVEGDRRIALSLLKVCLEVEARVLQLMVCEN